MDYKDVIKGKRLAKIDADKQDTFIGSITAVSSDIRELLGALETSGAKKLDKQVIDAISSLKLIVEALNSVRIESDDDVKERLGEIADILQKMNIRPVVNVSPAQVTVNEKEVNFDPLIKALSKPEAKDDDPLVGYKAQDIDNTDPHIQYVGFINSKGNWYIIENDDNSNSLRYVFGDKGYAKAFNDASKLNYKLFSEAINGKV